MLRTSLESWRRDLQHLNREYLGLIRELNREDPHRAVDLLRAPNRATLRTIASFTRRQGYYLTEGGVLFGITSPLAVMTALAPTAPAVQRVSDGVPHWQLTAYRLQELYFQLVRNAARESIPNAAAVFAIYDQDLLVALRDAGLDQLHALALQNLALAINSSVAFETLVNLIDRGAPDGHLRVAAMASLTSYYRKAVSCSYRLRVAGLPT